MKKSIVFMSLVAGLGLVQNATATDVKVNFTFLDADASIYGYVILDDSVLGSVYNGGTMPADGGLIDFSKVKELSLDYSSGEFASAGGHFTLADYSSLQWTSDVPIDFYTDIPPAGNDIAWQWEAQLGVGALNCTNTVGHVSFSLGRVAGGGAPTALGPTCMAGTTPDVSRIPTLHNLYLDTSYVPTTPVPEPSTYALMLAGLGVLGWSARRRHG